MIDPESAEEEVIAQEEEVDLEAGGGDWNAPDPGA